MNTYTSSTSTQQYFRSGEELSEEAQAALAWVRSYSGTFDFLNDMKAKALAGMQLSEKQVDAIARCKAREDAKLADQADRLLDEFHGQGSPAVAPKPARAAVVADGIYKHDGDIVKVQVAVHGSGRLYAKRLTFSPGDTSGKFVYEAGLVYQLDASELLTQEEAAAFGKLYGFCCMCGKTLTDETSIELGIGPICRGKF